MSTSPATPLNNADGAGSGSAAMPRNDTAAVNQLAGDAARIRARFRSGDDSGPTAGLAPGFAQANIAILPADDATEFLVFCAANAQACPVLAMSQAGDTALPALGDGIDIRCDLPRYRIYRDGLSIETTDVVSEWRNDLVTIAIGCSFTFDDALVAHGIIPRHVAERCNVAMYRTSIETTRVGRFQGPLVVSMRPFAPAMADRVAAISAGYPRMHGAPVHRGDPAMLGISEIGQPDYGDAVVVEPGEEFLFWACGVTSQVALQSAGLPFFIAHAPGCMLITDLRRDALVG